MRENVFHGRNSITCANNVLPTCMVASDQAKVGKLPHRKRAVQIGDTLTSLETRVVIDFQRDTAIFPRTGLGLSPFFVVAVFLVSVLVRARRENPRSSCAGASSAGP